MTVSPEVFDAWVASIVDVDLYSDESGWQVERVEPPEVCYVCISAAGSVDAGRAASAELARILDRVADDLVTTAPV